MNIELSISVRTVQRTICAMLVALLVVAGLPFMQAGRASAAQFSNRSIQMSDASLSGGSITSGVGSGTNVTYQVTFTPTVDAQSLVVDFCVTTPIIGDTCTAPTGMGAATGISGVSGNAGGTGWTLTAGSSQAKLASDGVAGHKIAAGTEQVFRISGITNPSTADPSGSTVKPGTFYARIYTFANTSWGTYSSATSTGNYVDYGGIALSLNNVITITARVQESLTFCVTSSPHSNWTTNYNCSDPNVASNLPSLILGQGSPTAVLDATRVDTGTIYSQLSTNATHGAVISLRNSNTTCGGLSADNGTTCAIPPLNSGSATPSAMTAGTAGFGLFVSDGAPMVDGSSTTIGSGTITARANYHDPSHATTGNMYYGMDTATATAATSSPLPAATYNGGVTGLFGSILAYATAPTYLMNNTYTFAATPSLTTPAGIYTGNFSMIATGTF